MSAATIRDMRRHAFAQAGVDLGQEPPIEGVRRGTTLPDRRRISLRWLGATMLVGVAGGGLIAAAIYAALDRQAVVIQSPEYVANSAEPTHDADEGLRKGDRLIRSADVVSEKHSFAAPVTFTAGDKQVVRMESFTRVSTTLTLASTGLADQVPAFNPLKLLAGDQEPADTPVDPGPALDDSDAAFTTADLGSADPTAFKGALSDDEVRAQVADFAKALSESDKPLALPPQLLLMRTSRATLGLPSVLPYAAESIMPAPFSNLQVKMVAENVSVIQQTDRPHEAASQQERIVVLRRGETLEDLLRDNGASRDQVRAIVTAFGAKRGEAPVNEGRRLRLLIASPDGRAPAQIVRVSVYAEEALETTIALDDGGSYVQVAHVDPHPQASRASRPHGDDDEEDNSSGGMDLYESLYETALKQSIPKPVIDDLVRVFGNDVDFQASVNAGDTFDAFYTHEDGDNRDDLLYASITVRNETFKYYRFQAPDDGSVDFYDESGRSTRRFLIRKPVPVGEMTSGFGVRFHPILGYTRPHTGVDWGAPIGTPILAAGSGTVLTAERNSSYGNHIEVQHANGYITTYSHMSGFARGITSGVHVRQGQVIGYLGQTGLATGPHLHYEVIVNGHFVDPMRVKLARTREMDGKLMASFRKEHDRIDTLMASAPTAVHDDKRASN